MRRSIRWRLALSFAAIALITTATLGAVLLVILEGYYGQMETDYLSNNARAIAVGLQPVIGNETSMTGVMDTYAPKQASTFAFLSQTRIRLFDDHKRVVWDSGVPEQMNVVFGVLKSGSAGVTPEEKALAQQKPGTDASKPIDQKAAAAATATAISGQDSVAAQKAAAAGDEFQQVITFGNPVTKTLSFFTKTVSADTLSATPAKNQPSPILVASTELPVVGTPFGFRLSMKAGESGRRSGQAVSVPLYATSGAYIGTLQLSDGPAYGQDILTSVALGWAVAGALAVVLAAVAGWLISRRISAPLLGLTAATARMAAGDLSARAGIAGHDEFGRLGHSFDEMADQVQTTIHALRRFVSDAAHELHTPLTALRSNLDLAADEGNATQRAEYLRRAQATAVRMEELTNNLLDLRIEGTPESQAGQTADLAAVLRRNAETYASRAEQAGLLFQLQTPGQPVVVRGHDSQAQRVVDNLVENAVKFTPDGGRVRVTLAEERGAANLVVADSGIGIPPDDLPRVFDRFHRGRNATAYEGSGLGLAIVKAIVEQHGGTVAARNGDSGAVLTVTWPLAQMESSG